MLKNQKRTVTIEIKKKLETQILYLVQKKFLFIVLREEVHIDFADVKSPVIERVDCDFESFGYSLCIADTKSSHADCTTEYAAVLREMKAAAGVFGKGVLREVSKEELLKNISKVRQVAGARAALRAIHFVMENDRVKKETEALNIGDFEAFFSMQRHQEIPPLSICRMCI